MSYDQLGPVERRAVELATVALHAGIRDDWAEATRAGQQIVDECGPTGVGRAILAWSDTLIARTPRQAGDGPFLPVWQNTETGQIAADPAEVPPRSRWAGRVIAARAAKDEDAWWALVGALPDDARERGSHVGAVLETVVLGLRGIADAGSRGGGR